MTRTDIPQLDPDLITDVKRVQVEANNNKAFFTERTYLDTGETVGDNEFWSLKIIEEYAPFDRDEGLTWYFAIKNLEDIPTEDMVDGEIDTIHLDRAEPDETGEARFVITESYDFNSLDELFAFCHSDEDSEGDE